jgi:hypothetical protein
MTAEQKQLARGLGLSLGQYLHYRMMERWGAPRWAAASSAAIVVKLTEIKFAIEDNTEAQR